MPADHTLSEPAAKMAETAEMERCWYLYLIECADNSIYTGIAVDVAARYAAHVRGKGARYTRAHPPRRLLAVLRCPDRSSAAREEYRVKQLNAAAKRALVAALNATDVAAMEGVPAQDGA